MDIRAKITFSAIISSLPLLLLISVVGCDDPAIETARIPTQVPSTPIPTATNRLPIPTPTPPYTPTSTFAPTATLVPELITAATSEPTEAQTPSPIPTASHPPTPTTTPMNTPTSTPTPSQLPTATATPVPTSAPSATATATYTLSPTATSTHTPTATATPTLTPTATPTPTARQIAVARLAEIIPWFETPKDSNEAVASRTLISVWLLDAEVGLTIAKLPWVLDGVIEIENNSIAQIATIAESDTATAATILNYQWLVDGIGDDGYETVGLEALGKIAKTDPAAATETSRLTWVANGLDGEDDAVALEALGTIATSDTEFLREILGFPWIPDQLTHPETAFLREIAGRVEENPETSRVVLGLHWIADDVSEIEATAAEFLFEIARLDAQVAQNVAGYQWVEDGINELELPIFRELRSTLRDIARSDAVTARIVADYPWISDGVNVNELSQITFIPYEFVQIALADVEMARIVAAYPFMIGDDLAYLRSSLHNIRFALHRIGVENPDLARRIAGLSWIADGISDFEKWEFGDWWQSIERIAVVESELGTQVFDIPWVNGGVWRTSSSALIQLAAIAETDREMARQVASLPWIDNEKIPQQTALEGLAALVKADRRLLERALVYPWVADDMGNPEIIALKTLGELATVDLSIADEVMRLPWVADDNTVLDTLALLNMLRITGNHPSLAKELADSITDWSPSIARYALNRFAVAVANQRSALDRLVNQSWYFDGLDDQEVVFASTAAADADYFPQSFDAMVPTDHVVKHQVSLPHSGIANIWMIDNRGVDPVDEIVRSWAQAVRKTEQDMGISFPENDIFIFNVEDVELRRGLQGGALSGRVIYQIGGDTNFYEHTAYRHIAHFYFNPQIGRNWLILGGIEFLARYTQGFPDSQNLEGRISTVNRDIEHFCTDRYGTTTIEEMIDQGGIPTSCHRLSGESLLLNILEISGAEATFAALADLHTLARINVDNSGNELYQTFLRFAPEEFHRQIEGVFRRIHGGEFLDEMEEEPQCDMMIPPEQRERNERHGYQPPPCPTPIGN